MLQDRKPRFQEASELMSAADEGESPALGASRVGAELRAARQRLGWALPDVAATLRIRLPYLEAIEEGRLADLPGNAYAVGFLRSYASFLGLDAAEVARRFRAEAQEVNRKPVLSFPAPVPQRGVPAMAVVLLGVVLAAGSYAGWYRFSGNTPGAAPVIPAVPERLGPLAEGVAPVSTPSPQVASILPPPVAGAGTALPVPSAGVVANPVVPAPAVVPPPPPPVAVAPPEGAMVVHVKADSWVMVKTKAGKALVNRTLKAGESWPVPKGEPLTLSTGNAAATEVLVDGVAMPVSLGTGVKRDIALDPAALKDGPRPDAPKPGKPNAAKTGATGGEGAGATAGAVPGTAAAKPAGQ